MTKLNRVIAGLGVVAGLGVALAPLSAFAETATTTTVVDTLQVTVGESITFGIDANGDRDYGDTDDIAPVVHTDGTTGTWDDAASINATLSRDMVAGEKDENFGQTALKVISNANGGYDIKAAGTALTGPATVNSVANPASGKTIPKGTSIDGSHSNWAYKAAVSGGSLELSGVTADTWTAAPDNATKIAGSTAVSANTGDTLTVTYGVSVDGAQTAGTYSGTMTYTVGAAGF